jgi:hypothetical protein
MITCGLIIPLHQEYCTNRREYFRQTNYFACDFFVSPSPNIKTLVAFGERDKIIFGNTELIDLPKKIVGTFCGCSD